VYIACPRGSGRRPERLRLPLACLFVLTAPGYRPRG
jgi:hypothetical protein